jgi:putative molybdopterin biosynthesis protein
VVPREMYESDLLKPLWDLIRGPDFRQQVQALGGYDTSRMGEVVAEI